MSSQTPYGSAWRRIESLIDAKLLALADDVLASTSAPQEREASAEAARQDVNAFVEYVMRDEAQKPVAQSAIHRSWQAHWSAHPRAGILAPWGHGKTSAGIARVLWELGRNPNLRIRLVCASDDVAVQRLYAVKSYIEQSGPLHEVFPDLKPGGEWSAHSCRVAGAGLSKDPSIMALGMMTKRAIGGRCDLLFVDDPVDISSLFSPMERIKAPEIFRNLHLSRLDEGGVVRYVATAWHKEDLSHVLMADAADGKGFSFLIQRVAEDYSCIEQEIDGRPVEPVPLWSAKWSAEALADQRSSGGLGERAWQRGMRQCAISDEELAFPSFEANCWETPPPETLSPFAVVAMGVDPSGRGRKGTAVVAVATMEDGSKVVVDAEVMAGTHLLGACVLRMFSRWRPSQIVVEDNATQASVEDLLRSEARFHSVQLPLVSWTTTSNKRDLEIGLPALETEFSNRMWRFYMPNDGDPRRDAFQRLRAEFRAFPFGATDDMVMATWFAHQGLSKRVNLEAAHAAPSKAVQEEMMGSLNQTSRWAVGGSHRRWGD